MSDEDHDNQIAAARAAIDEATERYFEDWNRAEDFWGEGTEVYDRVRRDILLPPSHETDATNELIHNANAITLIKLLTSGKPLHLFTCLRLAEWLLEQQQKGKIKRGKRGNPHRDAKKKTVFLEFPTTNSTEIIRAKFTLSADNFAEMVNTKVMDGMGTNEAIRKVCEMASLLDPTGNHPLASETSICRAYRRLKELETERIEQERLRDSFNSQNS